MSERRVLLVLDSLEHLLPSVAEVARLVAACPELVVLATSRAPLRVRSEREFRVDPLPAGDAVRLFQERLSAAGSSAGEDDPQTIDALAEQADGLPLAVELSASAAAMWGPVTLLQHMESLPTPGPRDLPERQRSMTATLAWSRELLTVRARSVLARLSVCVGGFSLALAEQVGTDDPSDALAALTELLEHSLVVRMPDVEGRARFRLLQPIRQYAGSYLRDDDRGAAHAGVARAMLGTARELVPQLRGASQVRALRLLEADRGNLRTAFEVLVDDGRHDDAAELLWAVWNYLAIRGHARDGRLWSERLTDSSMSDLGRARWLIASAGVEHVSDPNRGCRRAQEAFALARDSGATLLAAEAATLSFTTAMFAGDLAGARELRSIANDATLLAGDAWARMYVLAYSGQEALLAGDLNNANRLFEEAETVARDVGSSFELATVLTFRGMYAEADHRPGEAATVLVEAVELAVASGSRWTMTYILAPLARVAVQMGEMATAVRLLGATASYTAEQTATDYGEYTERAHNDLDRLRTDLGSRSFDEEWRLGREAATPEILGWAQTVLRSTGPR